ncbi:unnamed protein product [Lymnaea stagnalis]|uniref:C-type lectin domain-containing protein n=1 Tax=Lymnaea stagnalis TaxID=6523 RepID=A0AAV2H8Z7_LYMST
MTHTYYSVLLLLSGTFVSGLFGAKASSCPQHVMQVSRGHTSVYNHVCYLFVDEEIYWTPARDRCWNLGGEMLSIENEETMTHIQSKLNSPELGWRRNGVWLGAKNKAGRWRWTNGRPMEYTNWAMGQPSQVLGPLSVEDCTQMRSEDNWKWHDHICGSLRYHYNYICQFPLSKPGDGAGRVSESAKQQDQDNGNARLLAIIVGLGTGLLVVMGLVFLILHYRYRKSKLKAQEGAVHYSNNTYQSNTAHSHDQQPPQLPYSRPPLSDHQTALYTEVVKPNNHLHMVSLPDVKSITHSPERSSELSGSPVGVDGAWGGSDQDFDLKSPLINEGVSSDQGQYVDMNAIAGAKDGEQAHKEDKHMYSNVDLRDKGVENHYEVLA